MMDDRKSLTDFVVFIGFLIAFGMLGGGAKVLRTWEDGGTSVVWMRRAGAILSSVFASIVIGTLIREWMKEYPIAVFGLAGLGAWAGAELLDKLSQVLERQAINKLGGGGGEK